MFDDRDDVESVAQALSCPKSQAERVLEELERQGLVKKGPRRNQWDTTPEGHSLAWEWRPPRRYAPAIDWEGATGINELFVSVRCGVWHATDDQEEEFEEAELTVGTHGDYDSDRLIEIDIVQPDDYGDEHASSTCDRCVYISPTEARAFMAGLEKAIARAENELKQRAVIKERRKKRDDAKRRARLAKAVESASKEAADSKEAKPTVEAVPSRIAESLAEVRAANRAKRKP